MKRLRPCDLVLILGFGLLFCALFMMVLSMTNERKAATDIKETLTQLRAVMPKESPALPDTYANASMPSIALGDHDWCGILSLPLYDCELPICETWDAFYALRAPCKYMGSVYDGTLIVGGSDKAGQMDFIGHILPGEDVYITDTLGGKYAYTVTKIQKSTDVSSVYLTGLKADLVLFAKNTYSMDYTVILCNYAS